jgi:hypothetical protein
MFFVF